MHWKSGDFMASYKYANDVSSNNSDAFDTEHSPGDMANNAGIYKCNGCGWEIAIAKGHTLPPQPHHVHAASQGRVRWRLAVFAVHKP